MFLLMTDAVERPQREREWSMQSDIESALIGISHLAERLDSAVEQSIEYWPRVNCPRCRSAGADWSGYPMCATGSRGMKLPSLAAEKLLSTVRRFS